MIVKEHFDVIVVGTDLAPLLCAALLCKRGFRVLVVGTGKPFETPLSTITGQLDSPVARRILSELGISQLVRRRTRAVDPLMQIVTPRARVGIHGERSRLLDEFTRELPGEREQIRIFYERLPEALRSIDAVLDSGIAIPARGFIEKQRLKHQLRSTEFGTDGLGGRLLASLSDAPGLRSCIFAQIVPSSLLHRTQIAPVHAALLHGRAVERQVALKGGLGGLREMLVGRIEKSRGETKLGDRIEFVDVQRGRVQHVKLLGHDSATGCDFLVSGVSARAMNRLLTTEGRRLDVDTVAQKDLRTVAHLVPLRLRVENEVFPQPMADLVHVIFDEREPPAGANLVVLERVLEDPEAGSSDLWVSFLLDHDRLLSSADYARQMSHEVRARLRSVVPFLDDFILDIHDPTDGLRLAGADSEPEEELARVLPPVYRTSRPGPWSACGLDYRTDLKNLFICSREVLPGLGAEGSWLAAWGAAGLITSMDPAKMKFGSRPSRWSFG